MKTKTNLWKALALAVLGSLTLIVARETVQAHDNDSADPGAIELWLPSMGIVYGETLRTTLTNFNSRPVSVQPTVVDANGMIVKQAETLVLNPGQMRSFDVSRSEVGGGGPTLAAGDQSARPIRPTLTAGTDQSVMLRPSMTMRHEEAKRMLVAVAVIDESNGRTLVAAGGGCPEWMCGSNHNETLLRDTAPVR